MTYEFRVFIETGGAHHSRKRNERLELAIQRALEIVQESDMGGDDCAVINADACSHIGVMAVIPGGAA